MTITGPPLPLLAQETTGLLLQSLLVFSGTAPEGQLIETVATPWFEIVEHLRQNPQFLHELDWRKVEELVAGAHERAGAKVSLTPRSNDRGRDVIAIYEGLGQVKLIDQVKAYSPGNRVKADDVRAMIGVLSMDRSASKGLVTTTSTFAPGIHDDPDIKALMPYRLELKDRDQLLEWLASVASRRTVPVPPRGPAGDL